MTDEELIARLREISDTWAVCSYGCGNYFVSASSLASIGEHKADG